jgi:hypothetical protein
MLTRRRSDGQAAPFWHISASLRGGDSSFRVPGAAPGIWKDAPGIRKDVPGIRKDVPGIRKDVPGIWKDVPGIRKDVPGTWKDVPGTWKDAPGTWKDAPGIWKGVPGVRYGRTVHGSNTCTEFVVQRPLCRSEYGRLCVASGDFAASERARPLHWWWVGNPKRATVGMRSDLASCGEGEFFWSEGEVV